MRRRLYQARRGVLVAALNQHFGDAATILGDEAGMLVRFREAVAEPDPNEYGVRLASAAKYYHSSPPRDEFVMGFTAISERSLREGIKRLAGWR